MVEVITDAEGRAEEALEGLLTADLSPHPNIAQTLDHMFFVRVSIPSLPLVMMEPSSLDHALLSRIQKLFESLSGLGAQTVLDRPWTTAC